MSSPTPMTDKATPMDYNHVTPLVIERGGLFYVAVGGPFSCREAASKYAAQETAQRRPTPAPSAGERERKQPFERHAKVARHIERMAGLGIGSLIDWNNFLSDLNEALREGAAPEGEVWRHARRIADEALRGHPDIDTPEDQVRWMRAKLQDIALMLAAAPKADTCHT